MTTSLHTAAMLGAAIMIVTTTGPLSAAASDLNAQQACQLPTFGPGSGYHPKIDPADFTAQVDNPYFPLHVGKTLVYVGAKDGKPALDVVVTSSRTRIVDGVRTRIVEDRLYLDGALAERTSDYYAQDRCGNVWYFGEDTATLDRRGGVTSTAGSFLAGVDGAQPGVFMQVRPQIGRSFRQEWYRGQAEDVFRLTDRSAPVTVPYGSYSAALRTEEETALEPGVLDNKYYVQGIGEVEEVSVQGPQEKLVLVDVLA